MFVCAGLFVGPGLMLSKSVELLHDNIHHIVVSTPRTLPRILVEGWRKHKLLSESMRFCPNEAGVH